MTRAALTILVLGVVVVAGVGVLLLAGGSNAAPVVETSVSVVAERSYTPKITATGGVRLIAGARVQVGAQVSGVVRRLAVTQGSAVARGDLIAELDDREAAARLADVRARVEQAVAESAQAATEFERAEALARTGGTSPQELLAVRTQAIRAGAALGSARATERLAQVALDQTRIRSPIDGVIASVTTHEGETVASSFAAPTFVTVVEPRRIECVALVDETDVGTVRVGQGATFTVDAYPGREFAGIVTAIAPDATIVSGVVDYEVTIRITATRAGLKPQMTANVTIAGDARRARVVASAAVRQSSQGLYVWLLRGRKPVRRAILVGARQLDITEVTAGLGVGDTVLVGGFPDVAAGGREP
jgi:HlyD family secretion protein